MGRVSGEDDMIISIEDQVKWQKKEREKWRKMKEEEMARQRQWEIDEEAKALADIEEKQREEKEFNLSKKRYVPTRCIKSVIPTEDVKEFIRLVEAIIMDKRTSRREKIDKLHKRAGEELSK